MYGIYIHIPFCVKKCPYCDFNSYAGKMGLAEDYVEALIKEAQRYKGHKADTVFIGGGTPTCLPDGLLASLIYNMVSQFEIAPDAEITVEANPGTLSLKLLRELKNAGANRLSIGCQSLNPRILSFLGRIHTPEDFYDSVNMARRAGFDNISADMMFGLPEQTLQDWKSDIKKIISLELSHISCYSLKVEEGTEFFKRGVLPATDELDRDMYHAAVDLLHSSGYKRYEISNFARHGMECRHNLKYWHCNEYIGLGAGAHSFVNARRYSNIKGVEEYINAMRNNLSAIVQSDDISASEALSERIILGLRLDEGIDISLLNNIDNFQAKLDKLSKAGLLTVKNGRLKLSEKGIDLSNQVFVEFI